MIKKEYVTSDVGVTQNIELSEDRGPHIILKYLDRGTTGVKSNGMTVTFDGSDQLKIKYGRRRGFGFLVPVEWIGGDHLAIDDAKVVDDEIFTVNRAGFGFLIQSMAEHLPLYQKGLRGDLSLVKSPCFIHYEPHQVPDDIVTVEPSTSMFDLEKKYGTISYLIYLANRSQFSHFHELFRRKKLMTLKIPQNFAAFDLDIDSDTHLPSRFAIYWQKRLLGEYQFSEIKN